MNHRSKEWSSTSTNINHETGVKTAGRESSRGSGNTICSGRKACRRGQTEKEEMRQQQRRKVMTDMTRKIKSKGRMHANNSWWVGELLEVKKRGSTQDGRT